MIDVIIPAYNCIKTLSRTLGSLVAQTDNDFNVIIVDDYSTENIQEIVSEFSSRLKIKYIRHEKNLGCGMSRQTGIDNAMSEYITFLDSDDMFMPYTVDIFNRSILSNPNTDIFHGYFYGENMQNGIKIIETKTECTWCHGKLYKLDFIKRYNICNSPEVKYADDSYFNSICYELGEIHTLPLPLVLWTNNHESVTRSDKSNFKEVAIEDFANAMILSTKFLLQYKPINEISHLDKTVNVLRERVKNNPIRKNRYALYKLIKFIESCQ